jgi:hypothetical protein
MFTHGLKRHFTFVGGFLFIALSLFSTASHGQGDKNDASLPTHTITQNIINPSSVEQPLVPESVLAIQLAEALKLGPVSDEAKAEELLSGLGIEPENGWIAEYPVTPEVLGDVEKGIAMASDQGKIALTKDQALKLFGDVKTGLGFDAKPGQNPPAGLIKKPGNKTIYSYTDKNEETHFTDDLNSIPKANRKNMKIISQATLNKFIGSVGSGTVQAPEPQYTAKPNPEVINKQYEQQGPPVVTYYAPPDSYNYLYSWVPYPFWSTGLYYPGYFVLNDFHRHVFVNRHRYFVSHHHHGSGYDDSRSLRPGPVKRGLQGQLKPDGMNHSHGFSTPNAQAGAKAIVDGNPNRNRLSKGTIDSRRDRSRKPFSSAGTFGNTPVVPGGRIIMRNDLFRPGLSSGVGNSGTFGNTPVVPNGRIIMRNDLFRPGLSSGVGNSGTFGNTPVVPNGRIIMRNDLFRPTPYSSGRIRDQPSFNQRTYVPNTPRFDSPPAFSQDRVSRSPRSFGGNDSGGFQSGGSVGGLQGGGNFTGHGGGGSSNGASRGGHR